MILIHVWPDGSFVTQLVGRDARLWAEHEQAAKFGCERTYVSTGEQIEGNDFYKSFQWYADQVLKRNDDNTWTQRIQVRTLGQSWLRWAAHCMNKWGAWFTEVTGPTAQEVLQDRLMRLVSTRGECSLGRLANLVRPIKDPEIVKALDFLCALGTIKRTERANPRNKIVRHIYSIKADE